MHHTVLHNCSVTKVFKFWPMQMDDKLLMLRYMTLRVFKQASQKRDRWRIQDNILKLTHAWWGNYSICNVTFCTYTPCQTCVFKEKQRSRKILPKMKFHTIKYLNIAMICSVISFVVNNPVNIIAILLLQVVIFF